MIRHLAPHPEQVNRARLIERFPDALDVNEVNDGAGRWLAVYFDDDTPVTEAEWRDAVAAHDPTPPPPTAREVALARLAELRAKGWTNLTAAERAEIPQRVLEAIG